MPTYTLKQENLSKVFNEIVQFNASELQNGGGSGFGLWSKCCLSFLDILICNLVFLYSI